MYLSEVLFECVWPECCLALLANKHTVLIVEFYILIHCYQVVPR
jgi:hypothetical protein